MDIGERKWDRKWAEVIEEKLSSMSDEIISVMVERFGESKGLITVMLANDEEFYFKFDFKTRTFKTEFDKIEHLQYVDLLRQPLIELTGYRQDMTLKEPPRTALEVYRMLPEGTRCNVIENVLYMIEPAVLEHQDVLGQLMTSIYTHVEKTKAGKFLTWFDVYFEEFCSAVQPDLLFVSNENSHIWGDHGIYGAPDLLIEVLSDHHMDLVLKKNLYQKAGVKEYIVVDPETTETTAWLLVNGEYKEQYKEVGIFKSTILDLQAKIEEPERPWLLKQS